MVILSAYRLDGGGEDELLDFELLAGRDDILLGEQ